MSRLGLSLDWQMNVGLLMGTSDDQAIVDAVMTVLANSSTPVSVFGDNTDQVVAQFVIPANTVKPDSLLVLRALFNFYLPNTGGRSVYLYAGATLIGQSFPTATLGGLQVDFPMWVAPDLQTVAVFGSSQAFNDVLSPTNGQGAPFNAHTSLKATVSVDFTADQAITVKVKPVAEDQAELTGFTLENYAIGSLPTKSYAPVTAVAAWGDSLTEGSGSGASAGSFFATNGTTDGSTAVVTSITTTSIQPNMYVTGTGIPAGTIVLSKTGSTITLNKNTTQAATSSLAFRSGAWPVQLMHQAPGRAAFNGGVGGQTAGQITIRFLRDTVRGKYWNPVVWGGRNNVGSPSAVADVLSATAADIANLALGVIPVIIGVTTAKGESVGTANNTQVQAINAALLAEVGAANFIDAYTLFCTNNGQPNDDFLTTTAGVIAPTEVHWNDWGYYNIAAAVLAKRQSLGI